MRLDPPPSEVLVLLGRSLLLCWAAGAAPGTSTANLAAVPSFAFLFLLAQVLGKAVNSNTISDCARGRE